MTWGPGRAEVERLLAAGDLERVVADRDHARRLHAEAEGHPEAASVVRDRHPLSAYQCAYDPARKAASSLLAEQGLRATTQGGHLAVQVAIVSQLAGIAGEPFDDLGRLRRRRDDVEYPRAETAAVSIEDVDDALTAARGMVQAAGRLLDAEALPVVDANQLS